jgi:hypothetical protein
VTPSRSLLGSGQSRRRARQRQPTSQVAWNGSTVRAKRAFRPSRWWGYRVCRPLRSERRADCLAALALPAAISRPGPCDLGVGWFKLAEVGGGRPIYSVHLGRPIRHAITSLDVCPNQFGRPKKYDVSPNSFESPERCVDSPAGSADLLGAKTAHQQSRQRTAKGAIYECAFAHYRRREPQCSTGADGARPDKYDDFAFRRPRLWFLIRPRAMRIPSVGAKANLHLRPIGRPWTKTQAGKRL